MAEKGHWYTDKNGNHYFVEEGQTPKEGWEQSKRRKMLSEGKYQVDDGDGKGPREVSKKEYDEYEADQADFDLNNEDDFGFDEDRVDIEGYEIEKTADGKWINRDTYEYFDSKEEAMKAAREYVKESNPGGKKPHFNIADEDIGIVKETIAGKVDFEDVDQIDYLDEEDVADKGFDGGYLVTTKDGREMIYGYHEGDDFLTPIDENYDPVAEGIKMRGEGANPHFDREKFGKYFNPDGTLKKGMEDEYFAAKNKNDLENRYKDVTRMRKAGYSDLRILDELMEEGYDEQEVRDFLGMDPKPYKSKFESEDFGNMRTFPNRTGSKMDENNRWIGERHSVYDAHGADEKNFGELFKYVGNSKEGANIFQGPDKYYSLNPRINGESFKSIEDLEDYYANEGNWGNPRYRDKSGMMADNRKLRYEDYKKRKGIIDKKIEDQVNDGVTEDDIGYVRNVLQDIPGFNELTNDQIRKIISKIRDRKQ